jgi:hypothetical protein
MIFEARPSRRRVPKYCGSGVGAISKNVIPDRRKAV